MAVMKKHIIKSYIVMRRYCQVLILMIGLIIRPIGCKGSVCLVFYEFENITIFIYEDITLND